MQTLSCTENNNSWTGGGGFVLLPTLVCKTLQPCRALSCLWHITVKLGKFSYFKLCIQWTSRDVCKLVLDSNGLKQRSKGFNTHIWHVGITLGSVLSPDTSLTCRGGGVTLDFKWQRRSKDFWGVEIFNSGTFLGEKIWEVLLWVA